MTEAPILYMDAELKAHRSMSKRGLRVILGLMLLYNIALGGVMTAIGAFPVPIFLGLDVLAVFIAFTISGRASGIGERVQVTHDEVRVIKAAGPRPQTLWSSPTAFTRVEIEKSAEGVARVVVRLSGRSLTIAAMLGPSERARFAETLTLAITTALAERHA